MPKVALTDRFVQGVKTGEIQEDYFDDSPKTRGLCLRVSNAGRKTWGMIFTSPKDGKRARINFGTYPATSLAQARTFAIGAPEPRRGARPQGRCRSAGRHRHDR